MDADHHPVVYVDWCDAYAYCSGVEKRLCGAIGGGTNTYASYVDVNLSQWYRACSSGGADAFPYGNTYQATYCDGEDYGTNQTVAVGSLSNCVTSTTGFAGAFDLSGNIWEWEDSCSSTGQSATCRFRGGAFNLGSSNLSCGCDYYDPRDVVGSVIGFRCCSP
jgi:formylglycine-generating enzyme required for sulfatase activity